MESEPVIPVIIYSDSVIREHGSGKLSLIGTFQNFNFPRFPMQLGGFWVTVYVTNLRGAKSFALTTRIEDDQTGHVVASAVANVAFNEEMLSKITPDVMIEIPIRFPLCNFQKPGKYQTVILLDGSPLSRRVLLVNLIAPKAPPQTIE